MVQQWITNFLFDLNEMLSCLSVTVTVACESQACYAPFFYYCTSSTALLYFEDEYEDYSTTKSYSTHS